MGDLIGDGLKIMGNRAAQLNAQENAAMGNTIPVQATEIDSAPVFDTSKIREDADKRAALSTSVFTLSKSKPRYDDEVKSAGDSFCRQGNPKEGIKPDLNYKMLNWADDKTLTCGPEK